MANIQIGDQLLTLRDGRKLGYKIQGNPDGKPFFFFHGTPGSRLFLDVFVPRTQRARQPAGVHLDAGERIRGVTVGDLDDLQGNPSEQSPPS